MQVIDTNAEYGRIAKILPLSAVDGKGNRSVIFMQGCDFNCKYCHNPETREYCTSCGICVSVCPEKALSYDKEHKVIWNQKLCKDCGACIKACPYSSQPKERRLSVNEIINELLPYKAFIRGLTISGGECALQARFLCKLIPKINLLGLDVLLDTNGSTSFEKEDELLNLCKGVMLDVKAFNAAEHKILTGKDNAEVLKNLSYLAKKQKLCEVRIVVVPNEFNVKETIEECAKIIKNALDPYGEKVCLKLIAFRNYGVRTEFNYLKSPSKETMIELLEFAKSLGLLNVVIT